MKQRDKSKNITASILPSKGKPANSIADYGNDPFFVKKAAQAKKRIERVGFPKEFTS
ncbi:hypothetical protein SAMN05421788_102119 [Filimonas lacunae]|uniref:Uncharacterized protein n=1 Tax=Filimonas lacunae TaxID=477680 RepID=A0A173MIG2_9BACT|nr:hypothetical protein [Filimonas lacunae]BAV07257.1 hypothetical protein FLA_3280 [Filimonas lacunae]SIS92453.1 hypothetical protein SAMN05421788_102119 [Filimonas lacunae]